MLAVYNIICKKLVSELSEVEEEMIQVLHNLLEREIFVYTEQDLRQMQNNTARVIIMTCDIFKLTRRPQDICTQISAYDVTARLLIEFLGLPDSICSETMAAQCIKSLRNRNHVCIPCTCVVHNSKLDTVMMVRAQNYDIRFAERKIESRLNYCCATIDPSFAKTTWMREMIGPMIDNLLFTVKIHEEVPTNMNFYKTILQFMWQIISDNMFDARIHYDVFETLVGILPKDILLRMHYGSEQEKMEYVEIYMQIMAPSRRLIDQIRSEMPEIWRKLIHREDLLPSAPYYRLCS